MAMHFTKDLISAVTTSIRWSLTSLLLPLIVSTICCARQPPTIKLLVPNNFRGLISISADPNAGVSPMASPDSAITVFHIPESGLLIVKDVSMFFAWHRLDAEYIDGTKVPYEGAAENEIALRGLPCDNSRVNFWIGTEQEMSRMWSDPESWWPKESGKTEASD